MIVINKGVESEIYAESRKHRKDLRRIKTREAFFQQMSNNESCKDLYSREDPTIFVVIENDLFYG